MTESHRAQSGKIAQCAIRLLLARRAFTQIKSTIKKCEYAAVGHWPEGPEEYTPICFSEWLDGNVPDYSDGDKVCPACRARIEAHPALAAARRELTSAARAFWRLQKSMG